MGRLWAAFSGEHVSQGDTRQRGTEREPETSQVSVWSFMTGQHNNASTTRNVDITGTSAGHACPDNVAYHEAGHARALAARGWAVTGMQGFADGSGYTGFKGRNNLTRKQRRANLVAILAGQEAECQYLIDHRGYSLRQAREATNPGAASDHAAFARESAGEFSFREIQDEARRFVRRHAYTIETNAKPLARRGRRGGTWA